MARKKTEKKSTRKKKKVVDEQPKDRLTKEQYQEMQITFLKRDALKERLQTVALTIESHERAKQLAILQRNDTKDRLKKIEEEHKLFMKNLLEKHGIDIKGKVIDPITYHIIET